MNPSTTARSVFLGVKRKICLFCARVDRNSVQRLVRDKIRADAVVAYVEEEEIVEWSELFSRGFPARLLPSSSFKYAYSLFGDMNSTVSKSIKTREGCVLSQGRQ